MPQRFGRMGAMNDDLKDFVAPPPIWPQAVWAIAAAAIAVFAFIFTV